MNKKIISNKKTQTKEATKKQGQLILRATQLKNHFFGKMKIE